MDCFSDESDFAITLEESLWLSVHLVIGLTLLSTVEHKVELAGL